MVDAYTQKMLNEYFTEEELIVFAECGWKPMIREFTPPEISAIERQYLEASRTYISQYESTLGQSYMIDFVRQQYQRLLKIRRNHSTITSYVNMLLAQTAMLRHVYLGVS